MEDAKFRRIIFEHYRLHGRHDLPWRCTTKPYHILVSEIMLQQTQVPRVINKYSEFLRAFPTFRALSDATVTDVVKVWQGLGYNRRALQLRRCAQSVMLNHSGRLPRFHESLLKLPGIGPYTAGAILAFAFNRPVPVIETNIRRVYLHYYFPRRKSVSDSEILPLITSHLSHISSIRDWYGALMDYGTYLAAKIANPNRRSGQYTRQSPFDGSLRQLRGKILRVLTRQGVLNRKKLESLVRDTRMSEALSALEKEGFIHTADVHVQLVS